MGVQSQCFGGTYIQKKKKKGRREEEEEEGKGEGKKEEEEEEEEEEERVELQRSGKTHSDENDIMDNYSYHHEKFMLTQHLNQPTSSRDH